MTTIAFRDGVLAADRRTTDSGRVLGAHSKVGRFPPDPEVEATYLYAACGDASLCSRFEAWCALGAEGAPPEMKLGESDACGFVFRSAGSGWEVELFESDGACSFRLDLPTFTFDVPSTSTRATGSTPFASLGSRRRWVAE